MFCPWELVSLFCKGGTPLTFSAMEWKASNNSPSFPPSLQLQLVPPLSPLILHFSPDFSSFCLVQRLWVKLATPTTQPSPTLFYTSSATLSLIMCNGGWTDNAGDDASFMAGTARRATVTLSLCECASLWSWQHTPFMNHSQAPKREREGEREKKERQLWRWKKSWKKERNLTSSNSNYSCTNGETTALTILPVFFFDLLVLFWNICQNWVVRCCVHLVLECITNKTSTSYFSSVIGPLSLQICASIVLLRMLSKSDKTFSSQTIVSLSVRESFHVLQSLLVCHTYSTSYPIYDHSLSVFPFELFLSFFTYHPESLLFVSYLEKVSVSKCM